MLCIIHSCTICVVCGCGSYSMCLCTVSGVDGWMRSALLCTRMRLNAQHYCVMFIRQCFTRRRRNGLNRLSFIFVHELLDGFVFDA